MAILFALYGTIAHGVQRFRTFQVVAGVIVLTCLFITFVCFHQGLSPKQCVGGQELQGEINGKPDGRLCETVDRCYAPDAEPGLEYRCEHVGLFGTYSVQERIRYRGELQDPNEVSLAMTAGGSAAIAFVRRKAHPIPRPPARRASLVSHRRFSQCAGLLSHDGVRCTSAAATACGVSPPARWP